jgi:hypothetical protein
VEWTAADRYGNRELQGMPDELVRSFSKRTGQIDLEVERLEADGRERTPRLVKWTVHITRKPKAAPPKRGGGGCGRPSGPRGCGPCLGGWPPPLGSVWVGGIIGSQLEPWLGLVVGALAAMVAGWGLRFRASSDAVAWRRGAAGERRIARLLSHLERHGWAVLHDLAIPGSSANLDHLVIGPGGVFVIDSKQYRGRLQLDGSGRLWHGRYPLAPTLRAVEFEADRAAQVLPDPGVVVVPIVAVHGAQVPWGKVVVDGVPVVPARRLPSMLRALPAVLGPERVTALADQARIRFHAAA